MSCRADIALVDRLSSRGAPSDGASGRLNSGVELEGRYLLLDEPFEGLAPVIIDDLRDALVWLRRESGIAIVIVEHHARIVMEMTDGGMLIERGRVRVAGSRDDLVSRWSEVENLLAVSS